MPNVEDVLPRSAALRPRGRYGGSRRANTLACRRSLGLAFGMDEASVGIEDRFDGTTLLRHCAFARALRATEPAAYSKRRGEVLSDARVHGHLPVRRVELSHARSNREQATDAGGV